MRRVYLGTRGFTLVELIVVVGILGILALMALQAFNQYVVTVKVNRTTADLRTLDKAILAYYIDNNELPATLQEAGMGGLLDAWSRPYEYQLLGGGAPALEDSLGLPLNEVYDLYSKGTDGLSAVSAADVSAADDIVRSNDGQYVGSRAGL
jgi:prepilin-type N-terminal cleavage/methylation domain-containing protein